MKENKELVLYYILPYRQSFNPGGYYPSNETGCTSYRKASYSFFRENSVFFDDKEQLLNWFLANTDRQIPVVYRIKYLENYKGIDDVIQMTNLSSSFTGYYTILNKNCYAKFDAEKSEACEKNVWISLYLNPDGETYRIRDIYDEFAKRGIKIKCNIYEKNMDKTECFEFVGDPFYSPEKEDAKGKKLVLYRPSSKTFGRNN